MGHWMPMGMAASQQIVAISNLNEVNLQLNLRHCRNQEDFEVNLKSLGLSLHLDLVRATGYNSKEAVRV